MKLSKCRKVKYWLAKTMIWWRESLTSKLYIKNGGSWFHLCNSCTQSGRTNWKEHPQCCPLQKMCIKHVLLNKAQDKRIDPLSVPFIKCWADNWSEIILTQIILFNCHKDGDILSMLLSASLTRYPHADIDWALFEVEGGKYADISQGESESLTPILY